MAYFGYVAFWGSRPANDHSWGLVLWVPFSRHPDFVPDAFRSHAGEIRERSPSCDLHKFVRTEMIEITLYAG